MARPRAIHVPAQSKELRRLIKVLLQKVAAGEKLTDGFGMPINESHDASAIIDALTTFASHWEVYCRENALHPYTGEPGGMYHPWPGFEKREGVE